MPSQTQSLPITGNLYAKCLCISFPGHELGLIDDLDTLAQSERISRSLYIRRIIRQQMEAPAMTITLDRVTAEMLRELIRRSRETDIRTYVAALIRDRYYQKQ
jgi:hypothetical protein